IYVAKKDLEKKSKDELVDDLYDSLVEIDKLKRELRKYKNSNTPPSANQHLKPSFLPQKSGKKRGAPQGHPGTNRRWNPILTPYHITATECPNCQSNDIDVLRTARQQIDEIPKEIKPESKIVERDICECNKCHFKFSASDGQTPKQGRFGINLMVLTIMLRFIVRGVMRKTASFLDASFAIKLAPASVQAIITRAAQAGQTEYEILKMRIRTSLRLHVDETSFSVLGQKWWARTFRSDTDKLIATWTTQQKDIRQELHRMLTTQLC
ncbi:MAG: hypothetical protein ABIH34_01235, partial [Nanoarchaeota archaeon]